MTQDSYKSQNEVTQFHRFLVENSVNAAMNLSKLRKTGDPKHQENFKTSVDGLLQFYFFKYGKSDVEKPDVIKDKNIPPDMTTVELNDCKKVYFSIMRLQEELGHTTFESLQQGRTPV